LAQKPLITLASLQLTAKKQRWFVCCGCGLGGAKLHRQRRRPGIRHGKRRLDLGPEFRCMALQQPVLLG
jgi:hypothetical protein